MMFRSISFLLFATLAEGQVFPEKSIDAAVEAARTAWKSPGFAIAVVHDDRVVLLKGYGSKTLEGAHPVTPDTRFAIASMTKAFATASMALLADDGKMNWDDPVRKHLPYFRLADALADANVTLRDIASHRTGLSRHDILWIGSPWSREDLVRRMAAIKASKPFRTEYQYQNIMFTTAGEAVAHTAGMPWEEFVRKRIFEPLGMKSSNFNVEEVQQSSDHATGHSFPKSGVPKPASWRNVDNIGAAGSINSTARDIAQWIRLHLNEGEFSGKRIVSAKNLHETHSPQMIVRMDEESREANPESDMIAYGLGWRVYDYRGLHVVSHGGSLRGFRSHVAMLPRMKTGFVILSNLGDRAHPEALRNTLIDIIAGLPRRDWNEHYLAIEKKGKQKSEQKRAEREAKRQKDKGPSLPLSAYAGTYIDPAYGSVTVADRNGSLYLRWSNYESKLHHFHFDTFDIEDDNPLEDTPIQFVLDMEGGVTRLEMLDVPFTRAKK